MITLPAPDSQPRILGIYAHPDDETFCTGGTFARYAAAGCDITVVSATRGQAGQIRSANVATRKTLASVRELELRRACRRLGVRHVECWNYVDGSLAEVGESELESRIVRTIRHYRPDVVFTFGIDGAYGHPDHIAISKATTAACSRTGASGDVAPRLYHAVFPPRGRLLQDYLVSWLMEERPDFKGDTEFVHGLLLLAEEASALRFVDDHCEVKWFPSGFHIVEQGEPANALFLLLSGNAHVVREDTHGRNSVITHLQPGQFFGEQSLARQKPSNAHVIADDGATCLVLMPRQPTRFEGRGAGARLVSLRHRRNGLADDQNTVLQVESDEFIDAKLGALAAYRSQFPVQLHNLPRALLRDLFGVEYFLPCPSIADEVLWSAPSEHTSVLEQRACPVLTAGQF